VRAPAVKSTGVAVLSTPRRAVNERTPVQSNALEPSLRLDMESRFGADLGGVVVRDDPQSWDNTASRGLVAYTLGEVIHFGAGRFRPETVEGKALLAHELTHVLQQRAGRSTPHGVTNGRAAEAEARRASAVVAANQPLQPVSVPAATSVQGADATTGTAPAAASRVGAPPVPTPNPGAAGAPAGAMPAQLESALDFLDSSTFESAANFVLPSSVAASLKLLKPFVMGAWMIYRNPNLVIDPIKAYVKVMIDQIPAKVDQTIKEYSGKSEPLRKHLEGIWKHLKPKLLYLADNWWDVLKDTGRGLLFPWEGMGEDLDKIGALFVAARSHFESGEWSKAGDAVIDAWRECNNLAGRWYLWFVLAMALIGGIVGAIFGAGVGFVPGAIAGAEIALGAGKVLLISTVAAEGVNILKAAGELAYAELTDDQREDKYERIANSALTLGIIGVMFVIGELASKFVQWLFRRIAKALGRELPAKELKPADALRAKRGKPLPSDVERARIIQDEATKRLEDLEEGRAKPRTGPEDDLGWIRDNTHRQELSYDPDRSHFDVREGKAAVAAEDSGALDGPLRRAPKKSGGDFLDAKNRLWSHKGGPDVNALVDLVVSGARSGNNVLADLSDLSPVNRALARARIQTALGRGAPGAVRFVPPIPTAAAPAGVAGAQIGKHVESPAR
jgi:Domain of unknown function (DUF4157)